MSANTLSQAGTAASAYTDAEIEKVNKAIKDGVHFIGKVANKTDHGYKLTADATEISAANGDLIIVGTKEFIYSTALSTWQELGDEGALATKDYVDTAKNDAIAATTNAVVEANSLEELSISDRVIGDIGIVKAEIGESTGKY